MEYREWMIETNGFRFRAYKYWIDNRWLLGPKKKKIWLSSCHMPPVRYSTIEEVKKAIDVIIDGDKWMEA